MRINVEEMLAPGPDPEISQEPRRKCRHQRFGDNSDAMSDITTEVDEFESVDSLRNYEIEVSDQLIERCATGLSTNDMVVGRNRSAGSDPRSVGTVRQLALDKFKCVHFIPL